jgi:hypothetical protein
MPSFAAVHVFGVGPPGTAGGTPLIRERDRWDATETEDVATGSPTATATADDATNGASVAKNGRTAATSAPPAATDPATRRPRARSGTNVVRNAWIGATADRTVRATEVATAAVPVATVRAAGASDGAVAAAGAEAVGSSSR